jgi:hypothetical protein
MMNEYHGIVINLSQKDSSIFDGLDVIGERKMLLGLLVLRKIRVAPENLEEVIVHLQTNMRDRLWWIVRSFYFHFYRGNELIIVFRKRTFRVTPDPSTWSEAVDYGQLLGIPEKQLNFFPCRLSDEEY